MRSAAASHYRVTLVKLVLLAAACGVLLVGSGAAAVEQQADVPRESDVPRTFHGAGEAFRHGGREIGGGFRGIGRGLGDTFRGRRSADDYREGTGIFTGFKDVGRGVAGGARAVGRGVKKGATGGRADD